MIVHDIYDSLSAAEYAHLGDYSVPAAVVHGHLVDLLEHGERTFDRNHAKAPEPILRLLRVGKRFSPHAGGQLESSGSTAGDLSLAHELRELVTQVERADDPHVDMQSWTERALDVISLIEQPDAKLEDLAELRGFAEGSMLHVLECIMDLPAHDPAE
jgi:hypothetical protein